jgi:hypothetical protein
MPYQTYQQVRDVVARIRRAHQQLRDALEEPRPRAQDSRTRGVLERLRREEQELQIALAKHLGDGSDPPLDTWLQYVPDEEVLQTLDSIEFTPDMSADEVVAVKQRFDRALIALLRQLAEETAVPHVQEFFGSLLEEIETRVSHDSWSLREFQGDETPPGPGD